MIDIYTNKIDSKDWILQNDLYFNLNTGNEEMSQKEIDLIWQIDEAKLSPPTRVILSSNSKSYENGSALNVIFL